MDNEETHSQATTVPGAPPGPGPMPAQTQLDPESQSMEVKPKRELGAECHNNEPHSRRKLSDSHLVPHQPLEAGEAAAPQVSPAKASQVSPAKASQVSPAKASQRAPAKASSSWQAPPPPKATAPAPAPTAAAAEDPQFEVTGQGGTIENSSPKEREKHYAAFKRQVTGEVGTEIVPHEFVEAWQAAVQSKSKTAKNRLFQLWCSAGGSWSRIFGF